MEFEWVQGKTEKNLNKHGVDFADAVTVLTDDYAITVEDRDAHEERFITIGLDMLGRTLVVAYTWRGDSIRLISARKATPRERRRCESRDQ